MANNEKPSQAGSSANSSTRGGETLPSGSRLSLEAIRSLAVKVREGQIDPAAGAGEIIQEVDSLIKQVRERESLVYKWASGE